MLRDLALTFLIIGIITLYTFASELPTIEVDVSRAKTVKPVTEMTGEDIERVKVVDLETFQEKIPGAKVYYDPIGAIYVVKDGTLYEVFLMKAWRMRTYTATLTDGKLVFRDTGVNTLFLAAVDAVILFGYALMVLFGVIRRNIV
ncbi:hypothetical protein [Pyrococcus kukulkanii]|uniref:Uncharacterized protein n=1 Tax=Pyrococcus kukulkanii TaxID=1609559 RepID=A0ABV4T670_9EURY